MGYRKGLGVRTAEEIHIEKIAIKFIRKDFENKEDDIIKIYEATRK